LLFSIFEAWLIRAHADAKVTSWLGKTFSWAAYGNSIVAIMSGLMAGHVADGSSMRAVGQSNFYMGGYLEPFDIALVVSLACALAAHQLWEENYGESGEKDNAGEHGAPQWYDGLRTAFTTAMRSHEIILCGMVISLFEGSMYIFVFMFTPTLMQASGDDAKLPLGLIFSTFMVSAMAGSSFFSIGQDHHRMEHLALFVFALASASMVMLVSTTGLTSKFLAMNLFEFTVGMYFPVMGCLKSAIVPEAKRAAIYNLYRIPLNCIVLFGLMSDVTPNQAFGLNLCMLSTATGLQMMLVKCREKNGLTEVSERTLEIEPLTDSDTDSDDLADLIKVSVV
jgi:multisubunit Na+/H+ antiporter MnhC subunit